MGHGGNPISIPSFPIEAVPLFSPHLLFLSPHIYQLLLIPLIYLPNNGHVYSFHVAYIVEVGTSSISEPTSSPQLALEVLYS